jgi:hypothetical protein
MLKLQKDLAVRAVVGRANPWLTPETRNLGKSAATAKNSS